MVIKVPGYSSLTGTPETIVRLMQEVHIVLPDAEIESAEKLLKDMARKGKIEILEEEDKL